MKTPIHPALGRDSNLVPPTCESNGILLNTTTTPIHQIGASRLNCYQFYLWFFYDAVSTIGITKRRKRNKEL